jgi:uncharacterized small protein (DUF1192 family)
MAKDDDEFLAPRKPEHAQHVVGESLAALSVEEISERITVLRAEIERLEIAMAHKKASRANADTFFKGNLT